MSSESRPRRRGMGLVVALGAGLAFAACADFSRGDPPVDAGDGPPGDASADDAAALSFATDVYPLLTSGCGGCHGAGGAAADTQLVLTAKASADAAAVTRLVDTVAPAASRLLAKASGSTGHGGGTIYAIGSPEYETLLHWIQQGARP